MANSRKDHKGRKLREGESWRKDGRYVKVLQYIMGHAHIDVTMDVYNHVSEMSRIESEITRLESVAIS